MRKKIIWEDIGSNSERLPVLGGWIVRSWLMNAGVHQIFIPDKYHEWKLTYDVPDPEPKTYSGASGSAGITGNSGTSGGAIQIPGNHELVKAPEEPKVKEHKTHYGID